MTKVRCNFEHCKFCLNGICDRGSISMYGGECSSLKIDYDPDDYDEE